MIELWLLLGVWRPTREARVVQGVWFCRDIQTLMGILSFLYTCRRAQHKLIATFLHQDFLLNREIPLKNNRFHLPLCLFSLLGQTVTTTLWSCSKLVKEPRLPFLKPWAKKGRTSCCAVSCMIHMRGALPISWWTIRLSRYSCQKQLNLP